jgi:hypothetical protein
VTCINYTRHELVLSCTHVRAAGRRWLRTEDGCEGRVCETCWFDLGIQNWRDVVEIDDELDHDRRKFMEALIGEAKSR